jgi:hypothetical protein
MQFAMGKFGNSAEPLIEILNLCEQTLTALHAEYDGVLRAQESGQNRPEDRPRSTKPVRRLFVIRGGLSRSNQQISGR